MTIKKNYPELERQIAFARDSKEARLSYGVLPMPRLRHDQAVWLRVPQTAKIGDNAMADGMCGTGCCIAGNVVLQAGAKLVGELYSRDPLTGKEVRSKDTVSNEEVEFEGEIYSIRDLAQKLLGLDSYEAGRLFSADNNVDDIEAIVKNWANRE
jgi:hypothetical protein